MRGRARLCVLVFAYALGLAGAFAPTASAAVVRSPNGQLLGVTPQNGVVTAQLPGAIVPHVQSAQAPRTRSGDMTWHGGPVLHSSTPYLVFWDPSGSAFPSRWQPLLQQYFTDVAAAGTASTNVYAVNHQYWDTTGYAGATQSFSSNQVIDDTAAYPATDGTTCQGTTAAHCLTDAQVQQELTRLLSAQSLPNDGAANADTLPDNAPVYYVVLPPNVDECFTTGDCAAHDYCSYHSAFSAGGQEVLYDLIPSLVLVNNPKNCQIDGNTALQEPNDTRADVMLKYLTHEAIETITDPLLNGWWSSTDNNNEVADNCNQYGSVFDASSGSDPNSFKPYLGGSASGGTLYNQALGSDQYYLQAAWTNARGDCALQPASGNINATFTTPSDPDVTNTALSFDPTGSSSSVGYSSVIWNWGDGSTPQLTHGSPPSTVQHTYPTAGTFTVTLTIVDTEGNVGTISHQITVYTPPTAAFTYTPAQPFAQDSVGFDASGSSDPDPNVSIDSYAWNFGDGNTGTGVTASHVYANPGTYTVTLTVTNSGGVSQSTEQMVTVVAEPPTADFTIDPSAAPVNQSVEFTASAGDNHALITNYSWDFGDGATSPANTSNTATHAYSASGTYTVTLTVSASNGTTTTVTHQLTVGPIASFTDTPAPLGSPVSFDASASSDPESGAPISSYDWDFGDESTGSGVDPSHVYAHPGTYTVKLTVTNTAGETDAVSHAVVIDDVPPTAAFSVTTAVPLPAQPVSFDATGSAPADPSAALTYAWTFGDGATGSGATPSHAYAAPGTYTVGLTVTDSYGESRSVSHQVVVHALPSAAFSSSPSKPLEGAPVSFDAGSSQDPESGIALVSYAWRFGDGAIGSGRTHTHTYTAPGAYTVTLTITNALGVSRTTTHQVNVVAPPYAAFALKTARPASGQAVSFASSSTDPATPITSYRWTFGDSSAPGSGSSATHVFRNPGTYVVTLLVTDGFGHTSIAIQKVTVALSGKITKVSLSRNGTRLLVTLNAPGVLSGEGRSLKVKKASTVKLPLNLTAAQRRRLAATHTLNLHVVLRFAPAAGPRQTRTVIVVFRRAHAATARITRP